MAHGGNNSSADSRHVPDFGHSPEDYKDGNNTYMSGDMRIMKIILTVLVLGGSALLLFVGGQRMGTGTFVGGVLAGLGFALFVGVFFYAVSTGFMLISGMRRLARILMVVMPFLGFVAAFWWFAATHTLH